MAFRLVYQISCNVNKPVFLGNSSAECLRRFRSVSPAFKHIDEFGANLHERPWECVRRRSHSHPSRGLLRTGSVCSTKGRRSWSQDRGNEDETADEYYDREEVDFRKRNQGHPRKNRRTQSSIKLQVKRQSSTFNTQVQAQVTERHKPKSVVNLNKEAEKKLQQYHLKDSKPEEKKDNFFEIYEYYSDQYRWKDTKVLPHLQPHNLKPYGTGENLAFPSPNRDARSIKYPITEAGYTEQVAKNYQKKGHGSDSGNQSSSSTRDYSTTSPKDEQLQKCKQLLTEYKKINPGYVPSTKSVSLVPGSVEEGSFLQKTMKLIADFNQQHVRQKPKAVPNDDLERCNQVITEYKKLNPDYQPAKKELKSGSPEEKEAVSNALNFAANYKKYCQNSKFKKAEYQNQLSLKNKTFSECQVKDLHHQSAEPSKAPEDVDPKSQMNNIIKQSSSMPNVLRKKYSFDDKIVSFPDVPVVQIKVRVGPKANLLQSNALPEIFSGWDNTRLEKNEKLISPWPSYADQLKDQLDPKRKAREIIYPSMPEESKTLKNTKNVEIQSAIVQPTRSLHKNMKFAPTKTNYEESCQGRYYGQETSQKRSVKNPRYSLPDLKSTARCYSTSSKGNFCDEETVPPRSKSEAVCDNIEFEEPPKPTGYFNSHDCPCVEAKLPLDVPPLKRPKKRCNPKEPPKVCPPPPKCPPRADDGLEPKCKKLREIIPPKICPCIPFKMKKGCPLPRLKRKNVVEPEKICPCVGAKCDCPPRADECLKIKKKCLPVFTPMECPCIEPKIPVDVAPLKRLKKCKVEQKRVCPVIVHCDTPRADEGMVIKKKCLPLLKPSNCPCIEPEPPDEGEPLQRLKKVNVCEPGNFCREVDPCDPSETDRADEICGYKIKKKKLPPMILKAENNHISIRSKAKKSKKSKTPNVNVSHKRKYSIYSRMQNLWRARRELSAINCNMETINYYSKKSRKDQQNPECCCVEPEPRYPEEDVTPKLKRLPKSKKEDIDWSKMQQCPEDCGVNPRADDHWQTKKKALPRLVSSECPCTEKPPSDKNQPQLKRLPKFQKQDINWNKLCPKECKYVRTPRADDGWKSTKKNLPKLRDSDCPCKDPYASLVDVPPLKRLPKFEKYDVKWKELDQCTKRCDKMSRADDKLKKREKSLPRLKPSKCPCIEKDEFEMKDVKMKRLPKFKKSDIDWKAVFACHKQCKFNTRADDGLEPQKKSLPKLRTSDCPCIEPQDMYEDVEPLKRLPKFKKPDMNWKAQKPCIPQCPLNPRADAHLKPRSKSLPQLRPNKCPCIEKEESPVLMQPSLKRLPKFKKPDIDWKQICKMPCSSNPRADDSLKSTKKSLPKLRVSDCPCVDPVENFTDVEPIKRLPKFKKQDVNWKDLERCTTLPCSRAKRADDNLRTPQKTLPRLKPSKCPCIEKEAPVKQQPSLKRLPKFEKPDIDWKQICKIPCRRNTRADENWEMKRKSLPKLEANDCPCVDPVENFTDVEPIKRLPKFKKQDVNWKDLERCTTLPCSRAKRADDNLRTPQKTLPRLKPSKCPCIEKEAPVKKQPSLKRLPKFEKPDIDWKQICKIPCRLNTRADENWEMKTKSLPKLEAKDCPCVDPVVRFEDVEPLKRLPKFKKEDINWQQLEQCEKVCARTRRADEFYKPRSKPLPKLRPSRCPCFENLRHPQIVTPKLKRLEKLQDEEDPPRKCPSTCSTSGRADELLGYEHKQKKLPPLLPELHKKCYHTVERRRCSYPIYGNVFRGRQQMINTTGVLYKKKGCKPPKNPSCKSKEPKKVDSPKKECKKLGTDKKTCPKMNLPGCKSKQRETCNDVFEFKDCSKTETPYPSFSECGDMPAEWPTCECPQPDVSFLQPKNPIIKGPNLLVPPPPEHANIDTGKELECAMDKLGIKKKGETKLCTDFEKPPKELSGLQLLEKAEKKAKQEGRSLEEVCCENKSKQGTKNECPVVDTSICIGEPKLAAPKTKKKKLSQMICGALESKAAKAKSKSKVASKSKSKSKAKPKKAAKLETKQKDKSKPKKGAKAKSKTSVKSSTSTALVPQPKPKGLWDTIMSFFRSKPKLAAAPSSKPSKQKAKKAKQPTLKGVSKAKKKPAPKKSKKKEAKPAKGKSKSKTDCKPKDAKPKKEIPCAKTKKEAVSIKKEEIQSPILVARNCHAEEKGDACAKPKKADSCSKPTKGDPCAKSKKGDSGQKPKTEIPCARTKKTKEKPKKQEVEDHDLVVRNCAVPKDIDSKPKKTGPKQKKGDPCAKPEKANPCPKTKKKDPCPKPKKKDPCPKPKKDPCEKPKKDPCPKPKKQDPCAKPKKPKKLKPCGKTCAPKKKKGSCGNAKPKKCDDNSKFAKMFPPDMPDCRPRKRIRRSSKKKARQPQSIPMVECMRSIKKCIEEPQQSGKPKKGPFKLKVDPCEPKRKPSKPKVDSCKPNFGPSKPKVECKPKTDECKPKKDECKPKKDECKPEAKPQPVVECKPKPEECKPKETPKPSQPKSGKCQSIKTERECPKKERDSCEKVFDFKPCKGQETPYPSFSECRPPFPRRRVSECSIARERARRTLSQIKMHTNKKTQEDVCDDKGKGKGKRKYSTMSAVERAMAFHKPTQWRRYYSSNARGRGPKYGRQLLNQAKKNSGQLSEKGNDSLNERLLASIEEGIERLESQDIDLLNNPYYQILKALHKLSEKELYDFFDQEAQFNPFSPLKSDVRETVSYVCKLNPKADQSSFLSNDIIFQPRCVGLSDTAKCEEAKIVEAFRNFCNKLCEDADIFELPYEELERIKTEDMQRELDNLLRRTQSEHK